MDREDITAKLDEYRERFYGEVNRLDLSKIPFSERPRIKVFCADFEEYRIAQSLAPEGILIDYILPEGEEYSYKIVDSIYKIAESCGIKLGGPYAKQADERYRKFLLEELNIEELEEFYKILSKNINSSFC